MPNIKNYVKTDKKRQNSVKIDWKCGLMLFSQVAVFTFTNFSVKSNANQVAALDLKNFLLNQRQKKLQYSIVSRIFPSNQMRIKLQYSISRNFPSNQMQMKLHAGFIYFTNFSVKSDANQVMYSIQFHEIFHSINKLKRSSLI